MRSLFASALALSASAGALMVAAEGAVAQTPQTPQTPSPAPPPAAQTVPTQQQSVITRILVESDQPVRRIENRTVESYLLVRPGDPFDLDRMDQSLKALMGTGIFADVLISQRGSDLIVKIAENPIINRIVFEGNNAATTSRLNEETQAKPRDTFTRSRVEADVQRILEVYRRLGRFAATVTPTYKVLEQNRADLIYEIDEGPSTHVRSINFLGNSRFSDSRLRSEIATRQSRWWRFFEKRDNYNPAQVEYDREKLRDFYTDNGYADFQVKSAVADLTPDRKDFYITFNIEEGPQYNFGEIKVETQLEKLSGERLALVLPMKSGDLFRSSLVDKSIDQITFAAGTLGYANVDVRPRDVRNPVTRKIDYVFSVDEGPRVYIERIDIAGNTQTLDRVIRREIRSAEGDAYNQVLLDYAKNRIRALGFFKENSVDVTKEAGSTDDRAIVKVKVEEEATGELAFSAGFSSADAFLFSVSATQRNFRGRGQFLSAHVQTTSRQQDIEFRFTEPKFQDRNLAAGADFVLTKTDFFREAGFANNTVGLTGRLLFPLSDTDSIGIRYNLRSDELKLDAAATDCTSSAFFRSSLCDQRGAKVTSSMGYTLTMDRTDNYRDPTRGFDVNFSQDIAGLGGDINYVRSELRAGIYRGLWPGIVLKGKVEAGYIESWGDEPIRINNRFFKGGNSFRGFDVAGIGPREVEYSYATETIALDPGISPRSFSVPLLNTDGTQQVNDAGQLLYTSAVRDSAGNLAPPQQQRFNALGGKAYAIGTVELSFPIPYVPDEFGIDGALFAEFGTIGILDKVDRERKANDTFSAFRVDDSASLRASVGVSIFWDSPFGPIRFDLSNVLASESYDKTQSFRFATNTRF
jgi:outer membrane protein insertion porin family